MTRKRVCGKRCHEARGTRCKCVCESFFHGKDGSGAANRQALQEQTEEEVKKTLEQYGFKEGETRYIEQIKLPLEMANA